MVNKDKIKLGAVLSLIPVFCGFMFGFYKSKYKMKLKNYTKYALYMAYLDDEITRRILEGKRVNGKRVEFGSKMDTLKYRYEMFLNYNKGKTKSEIQDEIIEMEDKLKELRECI